MFAHPTSDERIDKITAKALQAQSDGSRQATPTQTCPAGTPVERVVQKDVCR